MDFQSHPKMGTISFQLGGEVKAVRLEHAGEAIRIVIADRVYQVRVIHSRAGEMTFTVDGTTHTAFLASEGSTWHVAVDGEVLELKKPDLRHTRRRQQHGENNLTASMPGQVAKVLVGAGDSVQRGQPMIVLGAMKMEIKIVAPHDGHVTKVLVQQGQVVDRGQVLVELASE